MPGVFMTNYATSSVEPCHALLRPQLAVRCSVLFYFNYCILSQNIVSFSDME